MASVGVSLRLRVNMPGSQMETDRLIRDEVDEIILQAENRLCGFCKQQVVGFHQVRRPIVEDP